MAKQEYLLLTQRRATLQAERVERWTKDVHDMTRTIKRLTWVNTVAVVLALLAAIASLALALHVGGLGR